VKPRFAFAGLFACAACAPNHGPAFEHAMANADQAEVSGQYAAAARSFESAAAAARLARDRTHAAYLAALMFERAGDVARARESYEALSHASPAVEESGAAAYKEAAMDLARGDERGWDAMETMLRRFPNDGFAKPALHRILKRKDETLGPTGTLAYLRARQTELEPTERAEEVAYEIATRLDAIGHHAEARDAFMGVAARWPYPNGALWDDALYHAAEIDERLGRAKAAIGDLQSMLSRRESSILVGSYTRPRYPLAQMLEGRIYRDDLHDAVRGREAFHAAYADYPTWDRRDEALWLEADLFRKEGHDAQACETLGALVREFPDSRYVPCASAAACSIVRPKESHAPEGCHTPPE
jgi:TolA-binding protein